MVTAGRVGAALVGAYLLGTVPAADVAGRLTGVDPRATGSGNPGAANVTREIGRRWGLAVGAVDVTKGLAASALGRAVGPRTACAAATAAVVGHVFPVWSGFRGGKGVATSYGALLGVFPAYALPDVGIALVTRALTGDARLANDVASVGWVAAALVWWRRELPNAWGAPPTVALPVSAAVTSALIAWRFRAAGASHTGTVSR